MERSGVPDSPAANILAPMFALLDICALRYISTSSSGTFGNRVVLICQYRQRNVNVGSSSLHGENILASMFALFDICVFR